MRSWSTAIHGIKEHCIPLDFSLKPNEAKFYCFYRNFYFFISDSLTHWLMMTNWIVWLITTLDSSWQPRKRRMKSELKFFQSLSWLFQLTYFVKCKRTLLELNFYQPYPSSWRETKRELGIFTGSRAVDGKEMYKKAWCTCKVVVLPCQAIAFFTFSSPLHLKLPIIYDTLWSVRNRIFSVQIELLLLIASETFFDSSVVPSFLVRKAWWTNRATVAR